MDRKSKEIFWGTMISLNLAGIHVWEDWEIILEW